MAKCAGRNHDCILLHAIPAVMQSFQVMAGGAASDSAGPVHLGRTIVPGWQLPGVWGSGRVRICFPEPDNVF